MFLSDVNDLGRLQSSLKEANAELFKRTGIDVVFNIDRVVSANGRYRLSIAFFCEAYDVTPRVIGEMYREIRGILELEDMEIER